MLRKVFLFALGLGLTACGTGRIPFAMATAIPPVKVFMTAEGGQVAYLSNFDIATNNSQLTRAIIIIHGIGRNNVGPFNSMLQLLADQKRSGDTIVIAPRFADDSDNIGTGYSYWGEDGWSAGDPSLDTAAVSSFAVTDQLITAILKAPSIKEVIITGMSAGGQFTQRYAAGNAIDGVNAGVHFHYVVVSPSSYMYLNPEREVAGIFSVPTNPGCTYDNYKFGIANRNAYMNIKSDTQLVADYLARDIVYMVGDQDNATAAPNRPIANDPKDGADLDVT